jgi:hypothetical protein
MKSSESESDEDNYELLKEVAVSFDEIVQSINSDARKLEETKSVKTNRKLNIENFDENDKECFNLHLSSEFKGLSFWVMYFSNIKYHIFYFFKNSSQKN